VLGAWEIADSGLHFLGQGQHAAAQGQMFPMGLAASNITLQNGNCRVRIRFHEPFGDAVQVGGIVLGYRSSDSHYIFAELGGANRAYSIGEFVSGVGWRAIDGVGEIQNLTCDREYLLRVNLIGQELRVFVDDVPVLKHLLSAPVEEDKSA
jgi:hypothetical protein